MDNILEFYQELCIKFYDLDLEQFHFIGITGTDGKTTTATIASRLINAAYIGTNGLIIKNKTYMTSKTTPTPNKLCKALKIIEKNHIKTVVMEVSSEALLHNRVNFLSFDIIGFTNITEDHLNIHKTKENYIQSKMKLFKLLKKNGKVLLNGDDKILQKIHCPNKYSFGFCKENDFQIIRENTVSNNVKFQMKYSNKIYDLSTPLKGIHNIYNVGMAFILGLLYQEKEEDLIQKIKKIKSIKGRGEFLNFGQDYTILLDYAHTVNAVKNVLDMVKDYQDIIVVTGAAGGREKEKRKEIGNLIIHRSNLAIFTMDDPRWEKVEDIIEEMVGDNKNYQKIMNRKEAIIYALNHAKKESIVLILGKGRDNYMAIEDKKIKYCDYQVIKNYFKNKR